MEFLGYLASLAMGIVLGLMGGGGAILTVPIMVYLFGVSPTVATGNSLFVVGLTALMGFVLAIRKGSVDLKVGLAFAVPSVIGVNISRGVIMPMIPTTIIDFQGFVLTKEILTMTAFSILMIAASYSMIKKKNVVAGSQIKSTFHTIAFSAQGLAVGLAAGFVGAGGGFLIIPALVLLAGLSMKVAVGTSLMIIAIQSLFGFLGDVARGLNFDWSLLAIVATISIIGIVVGSAISYKFKEQQMKAAFGWFVLIMGVAILFEQFHQISF